MTRVGYVRYLKMSSTGYSRCGCFHRRRVLKGLEFEEWDDAAMDLGRGSDDFYLHHDSEDWRICDVVERPAAAPGWVAPSCAGGGVTAGINTSGNTWCLEPYTPRRSNKTQRRKMYQAKVHQVS